MLLGIGIDIVDVKRFKKALDRFGERFTSRLFTEAELGYCMGKRTPELHLAARFAAKEAFVKAVGCDGGAPVPALRDIEVTRAANGAPQIGVRGAAVPYVARLSMSHVRDYCVAQVTIERIA